VDGSVTVYGAADLFPMEGVDTVLYHEAFNDIAGLPTVDKARTLYEYNTTTSGIRIASDASIILDQVRNNDGGDVYFGTGIDDLIDFLEDLHKRSNGNYDYELSLLIEDGRATTVIIKDNVRDGDPGNWTEDNMVEDGDGQFRLWGTDNAIAKSVSYNENTDRVDYSFTVIDPTTKLPIGGKTFTYDLLVYVNDHFSDDMEGLVGTTSSKGLIYEHFDIAAVKDNEDVDIYVRNVKPVDPVNPDEDVVKLTMSGTVASAEVYAPEKLTANVDGYNSKVYNLTEGDEVIVDFGTGSLTVGAEYEVAPGVVAEAIATDAVQFTITADTTITAVPTAAIIAVTAGEGITLTYGDQVADEAGESIVVKAGEDVDVKSSTGKYFDSSEPTTGELHVITATADTTDFTVGSDSVTIYAAATVTPGTGVTATYDMTTTGTKDLPGTRDVAVGTDLTLTVASANGSVVIEGNGPVSTEKLDSKITVKEDITLTAAWEVTLNDVKATIDSKDYTSEVYVVNGQPISAVAAVDGEGTAVIDTTKAGTVYAENAYTGAAVTGDLDLSAAVKIDVTTNNQIASVSYVSQPSNKPVEITDGTKDVYVLPGTVIEITGKSGAVLVGDGTGYVDVDERDDVTHWAKLTVKNVDLTLAAR